MEPDDNLKVNNDCFASIQNLSAHEMDTLLNFDGPLEEISFTAMNKNHISNSHKNNNEKQNDKEQQKEKDSASSVSSPLNLSTFNFDINPMDELMPTWNLSISHKELSPVNIESVSESQATKTATRSSTTTKMLATPEKTIKTDLLHTPSIDDHCDNTSYNDQSVSDTSYISDAASPSDILKTINYDVLKILEQLDNDETDAVTEESSAVDAKRKYSTQPDSSRSNSNNNNNNNINMKLSCPAKLRMELNTTRSTTHPVDFLSLVYNTSTCTTTSKTSSKALEQDDAAECDMPTLPSQMENINNNNAIESSAGVTSNSQGVDVTLTPRSVQKLYEEVTGDHSEFAFIYALSAQLCQDRVPMDCYVTLKMGLLLSLCSISSKMDVPPIPIVALGNDVYTIDYLMMAVGQLGSRFIGPCDDFKPPSLNASRQYKWIEADPIILAQGGVYYVGDWSRLKLAQSERLFKTIECSEVNVEKTVIKYPLQTAIWSHWRTFNYNIKDQQIFQKFVKIIGIPIFVAEDNNEALVDYILQQSSTRLYESTIDQLSIGDEDMRNFLILISERLVDWMPEANELLQKYFVSLRIARPDCLGKRAFVSLKQFAESFAKLSLRHEVLKNDVIASIILCEHFVQHVFGTSSRLENSPPPYFGAMNFIGMVDNYFEEFHNWLNEFIEKYYKPCS